MKVFSTIAIQGVVEQLVPAFEKVIFLPKLALFYTL